MSDGLNECPKSAQGLEVNAVADGYIVYQATCDRVHYLNQTAAIILELCNGRNPEENIPELLREAFDLSATPEEEVKTCLTMLRSEGLIL